MSDDPTELPNNVLPFPHVYNPWTEISKDYTVIRFETAEQVQQVMRKLKAMEQREQAERN